MSPTPHYHFWAVSGGRLQVFWGLLFLVNLSGLRVVWFASPCFHGFCFLGLFQPVGLMT